MEFLVHPKEKVYFTISLIVSVICYLVLIFSGLGIVYLVVGIILSLIGHGLFIGHLKGNGICVSENQFPEIHRLTQQLANQMQLHPTPSVYVLQAGGLLNAFATKFLGRNFVIIYSDVLELAYEKGESALAFVICHELAHIKRNHLKWHWLLFTSMFIPFLGAAYSRACEYTCDRFGAYYQPDGATLGLLALAAGKKLYRNVNLQEYINQAENERGFWVWFSEIISSHPNLPKRLKALNLHTGVTLSADYTVIEDKSKSY